jgi:hypothetical protein
MVDATDYTIDADAVAWLKGAVGLPYEFRSMAMRRVLAERGPEALADLFAQFIGLANSVIKNNREWIEGYLVAECGHDTAKAAKARK